MSSDTINYGLLVFTSFFTLLNPFGTMPVFLGVTAELDDRKRRDVAKRAVLIAFGLIMMFAFSGQFLFNFFHISVESFRVVGGAIFFVMGFDMLNARLSQIKVNQSDMMERVKNVAVTPIAIPMICGPGAITNAIVMMQDAGSNWLDKGVFIIALALNILIFYIVMVSSSRLTRFLGQTGINVMMRLMGLIIMVIAVEFFFAGLRPFLESIVALK